VAGSAEAIRRLYVFRLDRLARSGIRDIFEVVEELRAVGELVPIADGFELTGPAAEVVLAVMAWAAKMERLAIDERIAAARTSLELEGRPWGPPSFARAARSRTHR
jgi:DNA invertase Pin-like site-specific DNA recombinase